MRFSINANKDTINKYIKNLKNRVLATEDTKDGEEVMEGILETTLLELRHHQLETHFEKIWEKGSPDKMNSQCKG